jgi:hypothetical protein
MQPGEEKLVWACSCKAGGVCRAVGHESVRDQLEAVIAGHLRQPGNEGHAVSAGRLFAEVRLDASPVPLVWKQVGSGPDT